MCDFSANLFNHLLAKQSANSKDLINYMNDIIKILCVIGFKKSKQVMTIISKED